MQILQPLRTGDAVRARRRRWRVLDVRPYDGCHVITLGSDVEHAAPSVRRVIAPFDTIERLARRARPRVVTIQRWRRACRALLAGTSPAGALRAGRRARIDLLPHQLEPALAIVRGLGARLLLADDVGLGKTIQAALVLAELRERALAERALIVTPASLRDQWAQELSDRFAIEAAVFDAREVRRRAAELPSGVNPWSTAPVAIASVEYVKRPETLIAINGCRWDVLIVDEAHTTAGDSARHEAVMTLAQRSPYVLLLTATPHNGDVRAFASLCRTGAHDETARADPLLVFRRTRRDVALGAGRHVHRLLIRPTESERRMHTIVLGFGRAASCCSNRAWLALAVLNKRALSSAGSLLQTVERRLAALDSNGAAQPFEVALSLWDAEGDEADSADDPDRPPDISGLSFDDPDRERTLLRELADAARLAGRRETKIGALVRLLRRIPEPAIVFTEYRDTLLRVHRAIGRPAAVLHGGLTRSERCAALDDFVSGRQSILLATDAAGEGLNLQQGCRVVINLELPWNPMRLEQRIGRVDRIGQHRKVHAFHLIAAGTAEERILERLRKRIAQARADVGAPDPIGSPDRIGSDDDERAIAEWIVGGTPPDRTTSDTADRNTRHSLDQSTGTQQHLPVALKLEGVTEASRLTLSRRLTVAGDDEALARVETAGPWLAFSRRRATRQKLGGGVLCIFGVGLDDQSGRRVESMLVPILVRSTHRGSEGLHEQIGLETDPWRSHAVTLWHAVIEKRLLRERAVVQFASVPEPEMQLGLFDRRAERLDSIARTSAADAASETARRIASFNKALNLSVAPPQLLLVLAP